MGNDDLGGSERDASLRNEQDTPAKLKDTRTWPKLPDGPILKICIAMDRQRDRLQYRALHNIPRPIGRFGE
jgi:hypothetical protein